MGASSPESVIEGDVIEAAGGLVTRHEPGGPRIAVVYRERYGGEWGLPKGKRQPDESWQQTALREVFEETGLKAVIDGVAGATAYSAAGKPKLVLYWHMHVDGETRFERNDEVEELQWLTPASAVGRLSHKEDVALVYEAFQFAEPKAIGGWLAGLRRRLVPLVHATRWRRLVCEIETAEREMRARAALKPAASGTFGALRPVLARASQAAQAGHIDCGWRLLHAARRLELLGLESDERNAAAVGIRQEADKLGEWRKQAVIALLAVKDGQDQQPAQVFRAAVLRDEHYDNEAYKDALHRGGDLRVALVLMAVLAGLLRLAHAGWLQAEAWAKRVDGGVDLYKALVVVGLFGLLGATLSAIVRARQVRASTRIPEIATSVRVTTLRLLMGGGSAILLYFVSQSGLANEIFTFDTTSPSAVLPIAFVAGFTERLVLRVVETIAGKPQA
jgi:8-oxo-dGTP diphosphatase